jgi:streptogramin lyase
MVERGGVRGAPWVRVVVTIALLLAAAAVCQAQITFTEYPIPTTGSWPSGIIAGPDGNLWFAERNSNKIGRITTGGVITEFPVPSGGRPIEITTGPDGNLWFTEETGNSIGRITTGGVITEFPVPSGGSGLLSNGITAGPDGNLWFTEGNANQIGRITPTGVITEFPVPSGSGASGITAGPDGNLWFTEGGNANQIGRITPTGVITEFPVPTGGELAGITAGPDGNLWFTEYTANKIGRITPSGVITEFPTPTQTSPYNAINKITVGPDGNLWFTEIHPNLIGRITTSGVITEFPVLISGGGPVDITAGPDGSLWFTEYETDKIGKATLPATGTIFPDHGGNTGTVTLSIFANAIPAGSTAKLVCSGQPDIAGTNESVSPDGKTLTATFNLTGAAPSQCSVVIIEPDGSTLTIPKPFTIEQGGAPQVWVDIIGNDKIRIGREQSYYIVYGNSGNIDSGATRFALAVPNLDGFLSSQPSQDFLIDSYQTTQSVVY